MPQILNDPNHRYLSMEADRQLREHFELRMLEENHVPGLLPLTVCDDNGVLTLNYDISGKDTLASLAMNQKLLAPDIRQIILTLKHVISGLAPYLLTPSSILLSLESIYVSPVNLAPCFLYVPGQNSHFPTALSEFLQTLLSHTDHDDYPSVVLAYRLYKESLDHPSALDRLEQILISQESPLVEPGYAEHDSDSPDLPTPADLSASENAPLVSEIREVPLDPVLADPPASAHAPGLFQKLFRRAEEKGNCSSPEDEEKQWIELMGK